LFAAISACARDIAKGRGWIQLRQQLRDVQGEIVGNVPILIFAHADGRYTQAKEARVESRQLLFYGLQIEEISMNDFAQLGVRHATGLAIDHQNLHYLGVLQTLEQDTLPDHAG